MINKIATSIEEALAPVKDGSTVLIGGFGTAGIPNELIEGLIAQGARDLIVVNNNAGNGDKCLAALLHKMPCCAFGCNEVCRGCVTADIRLLSTMWPF